MSPHAPAETIHAHGCRVVLRQVEGPKAREAFLQCTPLEETVGADAQAEAVYRGALEALKELGGNFSCVVRESAFFRSIVRDHVTVGCARERVLEGAGFSEHRPARTEIEQQPLSGAHLELQLHAVVPQDGTLRADAVDVPSACSCDACAQSSGLRIRMDEESQLHAAGLYGGGADAHAQTLAMFGAAERLLEQAGMDFHDVDRTWIHLREMDRDYASLNAARRAFFAERSIAPPPASTGIGGAPVPGRHDLCLALVATRSGGGRAARHVMTTPTLNEAPVYGSDFARGMRVEAANKSALHVSGTASLDEAGETVHVGDFDAQVDRMLLNVAGLLEGQGARVGDVVSAITYVKHAADARRLRDKLAAAGFEGFPHALVEAPVCRPELLCEVEALAVLPTERG